MLDCSAGQVMPDIVFESGKANLMYLYTAA